MTIRRMNSEVPAVDTLAATRRAYGTLVIDPGWTYAQQSPRVKPPYGLMSLEAIKNLPIRNIAAENSHIYLWVTSAFVAEGVDVLRGWGFKYKTSLVWAKFQIGLGNYFRNSHELILFGVRGRLPLLRKDLRTWFLASRRQHSRKPDEFYELAEKASPGPRIDIFSREKRIGWDQWGNQTDHFNVA